MKRLNRAVSFILALIMVLSLAPASAFAAGEDTVYVLAASDFQHPNGNTAGADVVKKLGTVIKNAGFTEFDGYLHAGDYVFSSHNVQSDTETGIKDMMSAVSSVFPSITYDNTVLVQGNHDYATSLLSPSGKNDTDDYGVYVIHEDEYMDTNNVESTIKTTGEKLEDYLQDKLSMGYEKPIFVISHLPLHYGSRTARNGDAKYAHYLFDPMNEAGKKGLNIIYLYGHNHAYGYDNYLGGYAVYLPKGDEINIAVSGSTSSFTSEELNFTYMNAGFTGYHCDVGYQTVNPERLSMTVFAITGNQVEVRRYNQDGLMNLKVAGVKNGQYDSLTPSSLVANTDVYTSPQLIVQPGSIGDYVGVVTQPVDDVTTNNAGWVEITAPQEGSGTLYAYQQVDTITAGNDYVIVGNNHDVALMDNNGSMGSQSVTINGTNMTSTAELTEWTFSSASRGTIYDGTRYLRYTVSGLRGSYSLGSTNSSNTLTITDNGSNFRIYVNSWGTNYSFYYSGSSWTRSDSTQYVRLYERNEAGDVVAEASNGLYGKIVGDLTYTAAAGADANAALAGLKGQVDGYYAEAMSTPGSSTAGTVVDDSVLTWEWVDAYDASTPGDYAVTISYDGKVLGTAEVIVPAATKYYAAEGKGLYTVAANTSAAAAMAAVKAGVTLYQADDANGTNKVAIDDANAEWVWVDTYDGTNVGPYTVEIFYKGQSLGTVEVQVSVHYDTGINSDWTFVGQQGSTYEYVLDTNGIDYGSSNKYLIVGYLSSNTDGGYDYALTANGSNTGAVKIDINGTTATVDTRDYEWYFATSLVNTGSSTYNKFITQDGETWLYHTNSSMYVGNGSDAHRGYWSATHRGNGVYRFADQDGATWYLRYSLTGNKFTVKNSTSSNDVDVRLYKFNKENPGRDTYALIEGKTSYTVDMGTAQSEALALVQAGITGYTATDANGSGKAELNDSDLTWTWKNTYNGNSAGTYWMDISYNGVLLGTVEVHVEPKVLDQDPTYPNPGSVDVDKSAAGIDFQNTGLARVELSTSGLPAGQGVDVVVVVDTSSSMTNNKIGSKTRLQVLQEAMESMIDDFNVTNPTTGQKPDIDVAIMDFNGYGAERANLYGSIPEWGNTDYGQVYTGNNTFGSAGAFVDAASLLSFNVASAINQTRSGTNYDDALKRAYYLLEAKAETNKDNGEEREQYVIFLSDGAPFGWNGIIESDGDENAAYSYYWWNRLLQGEFTSLAALAAEAYEEHGIRLNTQYEFLYDGNGTTHPHRWAEAIKGTGNAYTVFDKDKTAGETAVESDLFTVKGLGATIYSIGFGLAEDSRTVNGFKGAVTVDTMTELLETIASEDDHGEDLYWPCSDADQLADAFNQIVTSIAYAARDAYFIDEMGEAYDLQLSPTTVNSSKESITVDNSITVTTHEIYTKEDADDGLCTSDDIGKTYGDGTLLEKVTFTSATVATSSALSDTNIIKDGVICAKTFYYNTTADPVEVTLVNGETYMLPGETFCWNIGTINEKQYTLSYVVYLTGSMEGTRAEGDSYETNGNATLHYINYLGNKVAKPVASPSMPWGGANVSYAFYLVDEYGNPLLADGTLADNFLTAHRVTQPVLYKTINLNSGETVLSTVGTDVLPDGYVLYDANAVYTVEVASGTGGGNWKIKVGDNGVTDSTAAGYYTAGDVKDGRGNDRPDVATTYVVGYGDSNEYSKATSVNDNYDYTHTTVYFAVLWTIGTLPDTVVVDYGLSVDINVLANDMLGGSGKLVAVSKGENKPEADHTTGLAAQFDISADGDYGTLTMNQDAETGLYKTVRYTPTTMQMDGYDKFAYAVNYTGSANAGYYYGDVTVIPATTIYYEDNFDSIEYGRYNTSDEPDGEWIDVGTVTDATQAEDRPGRYSLPAIDANNVYGYDSAYANCSKYSLNSAKMVHVDANSYATVKFSFSGTGFDVISLTDNTTGTYAVRVYEAGTTTRVKSATVDTFYGYAHQFYEVTYTYVSGAWEEVRTVISEDAYLAGQSESRPEKPDEGDSYKVYTDGWVITDSSDPNAIYQVPVLKIKDLEYGSYDVEIIATYIEFFDDTDPDGYDLYLDAIRIYDPAGDGTVRDGEGNVTDSTVQDAYVADKEGWPIYEELRNNVIDAAVLVEGTEKITGAVFVDGVGETAEAVDYTNVGPNNELYLKPGQAVAFNLDLSVFGAVAPADVQLGIKSADGSTVSYKIYNAIGGMDADDVAAITARSVATSTDMYYSINGYKDGTIVIYNSGASGVLSLTNIKFTFTQEPAVANGALYVTGVSKDVVLGSLTESPFVPTTFSVSTPSRVYVGNTVTVTVTTSSDVEVITVNGEKVTTYYRNRWTGQRIWAASVKAEAAGDLVIAVVAYDEDGKASETKNAAVTVSDSNIVKDLLNWLFGWYK